MAATTMAKSCIGNVYVVEIICWNHWLEEFTMLPVQNADSVIVRHLGTPNSPSPVASMRFVNCESCIFKIQLMANVLSS